MGRSFFQNTCKPEGLGGKMMVVMMNNGHAAMAKWGFSHVKIADNTQILDIGCGGGANVATMLKENPNGKICGMDYSEVSVAKSAKVNKKAIGEGRCEIRQGNVADIEFEDETFDLVTAFETIYFWPDLDQMSEFSAGLNQKLTNPLIYKYLHRGYMPRWIVNLMKKIWGDAYTEAAIKMMGIGGVDMSFVSRESCYNQDYYDAIMPLPEKIKADGTQVHIFYALKMGKKYDKRYRKYFDNPDIIRQDFEHEELLMCYPDKWLEEIRRCTVQ